VWVRTSDSHYLAIGARSPRYSRISRRAAARRRWSPNGSASARSELTPLAFHGLQRRHPALLVFGRLRL